MAETTRPIEEEFAVVVVALLAGRIDGQQAVQSLAALHRRLALSWLASVLADDATVEVVAAGFWTPWVDAEGPFDSLPPEVRNEWLGATMDALAALSAHLAAPGAAGDPSGEEGL